MIASSLNFLGVCLQEILQFAANFFFQSCFQDQFETEIEFDSILQVADADAFWNVFPQVAAGFTWVSIEWVTPARVRKDPHRRRQRQGLISGSHLSSSKWTSMWSCSQLPSVASEEVTLAPATALTETFGSFSRRIVSVVSGGGVKTCSRLWLKVPTGIFQMMLCLLCWLPTNKKIHIQKLTHM